MVLVVNSILFLKNTAPKVTEHLFSMFSTNFSFPFGGFRKHSTIFKFHELSHTFSNFLRFFLKLSEILSQTFSNLLSTFQKSFISSQCFDFSRSDARVRFHKFSVTKFRVIGRSCNIFLQFVHYLRSWTVFGNLSALVLGCPSRLGNDLST
jgi:hypothetical protein